VAIKIDGSGELGNKAEEAVRAKKAAVTSLLRHCVHESGSRTQDVHHWFYSRFQKAFFSLSSSFFHEKIGFRNDSVR